MWEIIDNGTPQILIINLMMHDEKIAIPCVKNCRFVIVYIDNWNDDLSLWEFVYENSRGARKFAGEAKKLLERIEKELLPVVNDKKLPAIISGYSLAGLFALWSLYNTDKFSGCISCSGSVWYPGFMDYVKSNSISENVNIYLSLGVKEEKTKDEYMSRVGDNTRELFELFSADKRVENVILEWNPGNHFTDFVGRMNMGYNWIRAIIK